MQVSGNNLPVLFNPNGFASSNDAAPVRSRSGQDLSNDTERQNRQQTVEYVFRGEFFDDSINDTANRQTFNQTINPANREAISSYVENDQTPQQSGERQGRFLDIFI